MKRLPRLLLILPLLVLPCTTLWAQTMTATATPSICANVTGVGTINWANVADARVEDTATATVGVNDGQISRYLRCTGYGFNIPTSATISGITVWIRREVDDNGGAPRDYAVQLLKSTGLVAANKASATTYPETLTTVSYGNSTDLWSTTWTPAEVNNGNFGVSFAAYKSGTTGGSRAVGVDVIRVEVTYDLGLPCTPPPNIPAGVSVSCVCDQFNRANLDPSTVFGQNWITSESDNTGVLPSIANNTVLRLTDSTTYKAKAATVPAAFPAAGNYISVEFNHYAYNGSGADGIAVTLSDYNVPAVPGAYGGSLGYAQQTGIDGFSGGWIGVALDEYGNYANPTEGRQGGPTPTGMRVDAVGIRGSGSGRGTGQYPWITGTPANLSPGIDNAGATARTPGHRYQIVVDARSAGAAPPQTWVAVNRDTSGTGGSYASLINSFNIYDLNAAQAAVPANWQISFTGSTGASSNIHEIDGLRICAQTVVPPSGGVASGFAVIDEAYGDPSASPIAVQNYLTGRIYTKLASTVSTATPFKLNIAAINNNQVQTGYVLGSVTKNVNVKLVNNSDGVCVLNSSQANYCSAACQAKVAVTGGSQTLSFAAINAGQKQSGNFTINEAWSNLVALVSDGTTVNSNGIWACSTDAFSVRPQSFTTLSSTANNAALTGAPVLRAGAENFSMTVGTSTTGYAGAAALPTINSAAVTANAAGWAVGNIAPGVFPAATASSSTGNTFTYSEAGHFRLLGYDPLSDATSPRGIYDSTWTTVDQGTAQDCIIGSTATTRNFANTRDTSGTFASNPNYGKYGCMFGIAANSPLFGRFIPDHFTMTAGSVTPACTGTTRNFTYMGQNMGVAYRLEARNAANGITQNYDVTRTTVVAPALVAEDQTPAYQGCDLSVRLGGTLPSGSWTAGVYNVSSLATTFSRPTSATLSSLNASSPALCSSTRAAAVNPFWSLDIGVQVLDGSATMENANMNAGTTGTCSSAACNALRVGSTGMVLGRLNLLNAYGSDALPLLVPVRAEFWNGSSWQLNTDDRCTTLSASNLAVGNINRPATGSNLNVTSADLSMTAQGTASATMAAGLTSFRINPAAAAKGAGSLDLVLNLGFGVANANWCGTWNTGPAAGTGTTPTTNLGFLASGWCGTNADRDPAARVRFGSPQAPFIYLRERY